MTVTVPIPEEFADRLQERAARQRKSLTELISDIIARVLTWEQDDYPTLEEVVDEIRNMPRNPATFHPAEDSLAEALANAPNEPPIDEEEWNRQWQAVEMEMKAIERANDISEGREWIYDNLIDFVE